ncbi:TPA: tRNA uridine-5-carboxymethylaminomethyl(34) synthesis GTPase MnmE, partial [Candidatus Poribacteria bacterium]|nr:tRNA uridine-5-carboxymethylaminomethyl(34) synthesis GTPase MnmE [Candidatus Poribacteria bacterium]
MSVNTPSDTIAAISTPPGEGGISIVRLSGPEAIRIADSVFRPARHDKSPSRLKSHSITYGHIIDPESKGVIDEVLLTVMRAPYTYTREDIVEINCHGGAVVTAKILELLLRQGARLAEPGEFTKRAFLNGRIDLSQAEAVIDLIRAKTDLSLKAATNMLMGGLSQKIQRLRDSIAQILAEVEASIDFPEEDLDFMPPDEMMGRLNEVAGEIKRLIETAEEGRILREGVRAVIAGKPNVGKSSLLNRLLSEERAIVT